MKMYPTFVISFIISVLASITLAVIYFINIFNLMQLTNENFVPQHPFDILERIFTPALIVTFIILILSILTYKILGITMVVRKPHGNSTHTVLFVLGFILMGFITSIIYLILNKKLNLRPPYQWESDNHLNP